MPAGTRKKAIGSRAAARAKRAAFILRDMLYALRRRSARRHLPTKPVLEPNSRNSVLTWPFASKQEVLMGLASYKIVGRGGEWRVRHDGREENIYQTKESAFEAAVAAASLALRQGHEVQIGVPGSETATGAANP
jgi:hypothetical protein